MTIVVDAAPIIALADREDPWASAVLSYITDSRELLVLPQMVVAEIDYLLHSRFGPRASRLFLQELVFATYAVECVEADDFSTIALLSDRYRDLAPGLADLSVVVLAHRFQTNRILTFDQRHFRTMAPISGGAFELLPMDDMRDR
ncbi:MAG: PIN domain-containing protein [Dehalococcoidia bacterium]|nr:PIN domain-containing protein [Dehalococcoidia bacterium]MCA9843155.1 PIN domain-containing protein [Dehalococcoidia bacterium]